MKRIVSAGILLFFSFLICFIGYCNVNKVCENEKEKIAECIGYIDTNDKKSAEILINKLNKTKDLIPYIYKTKIDDIEEEILKSDLYLKENMIIEAKNSLSYAKYLLNQIISDQKVCIYSFF